MKLIARTRLTVDIPFEFDVDEPDETGHTDTRIEAAKYAEELAKTITTSQGTVVEVLIEEVYEAGDEQ